MTVSNSKSEPMGLDEAVRMFAGYIRGENGFDELDFKEWLVERHEQEIAEATKAKVQEVVGAIGIHSEKLTQEQLEVVRKELQALRANQEEQTK